MHVVGQHGVLLCVQDSQISSIKRANGLDHGTVDKRSTTRLPVNDVCMMYRSVTEQFHVRCVVLRYDLPP